MLSDNKRPTTKAWSCGLACEPLMAMDGDYFYEDGDNFYDNGDYFYDLGDYILCSAWHRGDSNKCWMRESFTEWILFPNYRLILKTLRMESGMGECIIYKANPPPPFPPSTPTLSQSSLKVRFVGHAILQHPRDYKKQNYYFDLSCHKLNMTKKNETWKQ